MIEQSEIIQQLRLKRGDLKVLRSITFRTSNEMGDLDVLRSITSNSSD